MNICISEWVNSPGTQVCSSRYMRLLQLTISPSANAIGDPCKAVLPITISSTSSTPSTILISVVTEKCNGIQTPISHRMHSSTPKGETILGSFRQSNIIFAWCTCAFFLWRFIFFLYFPSAILHGHFIIAKESPRVTAHIICTSITFLWLHTFT